MDIYQVMISAMWKMKAENKNMHGGCCYFRDDERARLLG